MMVSNYWTQYWPKPRSHRGGVGGGGGGEVGRATAEEESRHVSSRIRRIGRRKGLIVALRLPVSPHSFHNPIDDNVE